MSEDLLQVENLSTRFSVGGGVLGIGGSRRVTAVDDVSFRIGRGETYGLVGESGCGKTTTGRAIMRLAPASAGTVRFRDKDVLTLSPAQLREVRRQVQLVFQDPYSSLNPRMRVGRTLEEPLAIHRLASRHERSDRALAALTRVGLGTDHYYRYPHEFSGGQRQRIGLARALVVEPELLICDEPVSALDVSTQSQVLNLMRRLQDDLGLSYLFISHDMSVVRYMANRVGVMYLGRLVEEAPADELFASPRHPYTEALISAVPKPRPPAAREHAVLSGETPSPDAPRQGCVFASRCPKAFSRCREQEPPATHLDGNRWAACHLLA